jgi:hypothetical protein
MPELSDEIRSLFQGGITPVTFEEVAERRSPRRPRPRLLARVASVAVVLAVAVPIVVAVSTARSTTGATGHGSAARRHLIAALDTTLASGNFDFTAFQPQVTPPTSPTTTTTSCANGLVVEKMPDAGTSSTPVCIPTRTESGLDVTAQGVMNTDPFALQVNAQVPGLGLITLLDNGSDIWEMGGGGYGGSGVAGQAGPGAPLAGFANSVEGTLGPRQGASDMLSLANPTGYMELDASAIDSADEDGTSTVDGVPVTDYQVTLSPAQEESVTGGNATQTEAISDAVAVLQEQGYTGTTLTVSVDADGYIRQIASVAQFADGSRQSSTTTYSNFGCAGTVILPGQSGTAAPPPGCVSPDKAGPTTTTSP